MSTIRDWRIGSGPDGGDLVEPFTNLDFESFNAVADDCQGGWMIYWRQNMPGFGCLAKADRGRSMKNWWPFLFY